jgi:hypothetical protein
MSIEESPLELTEQQAEAVLDFYYEAERNITSSAALAIVTAIARETVLLGSSHITHKEFGRRTGRCRRSIDTAVKVLKGHNLIRRVGTTDGGSAIYRAVFAAERAAHAVG